jgi:rRNA-processing protein FCF1
MPAARHSVWVVVDTDVFVLSPQVFSLPDLQFESATTYIVPATVLWELDVLKSRPETRERARSAINVIKQYVDRGACGRAVSCGARRRIRVASAHEFVDHEHLDLSLADDRILSTALALAPSADELYVATTDFAMYAKALSLNLGGVLLSDLADTAQPSSRRERAEFSQKWRRLEASNHLWALCRRGITFLSCALVLRVMTPVLQSGEPSHIVGIWNQWRVLSETWTGTTALDQVFQNAFGLSHMTAPNYNVRQLTVPGMAWRPGVTFQQQQPTQRPESEGERAIRIQAEHEAHSQREEFLMDSLLAGLETLREFVITQLQEDIVFD